jgi:lysophospholipid acyltransferase (LPLAT)-like uncharacterized protein
MLERFKFWLFSSLGYWAMRAITCTLRWEVEGWENYVPATGRKDSVILTFWHGRILPATYFFRNRGVIVMTSMNRDGEYIARVIKRFGYVAARGSSSRGGRTALVEMVRGLRSGSDVAFTIDGPRGPRYVAKQGAVWLAARTGHAICPFHICAKRKWELNSWDRFQIPIPFTRMFVIIAPPILVPREASEPELEPYQAQLQRTLDELLNRADSHWSTDKRNAD